MKKSITIYSELEIIINNEITYTDDVEVTYKMDTQETDCHPDAGSPMTYAVAIIEKIEWNGKDITSLVSERDNDKLSEEVVEFEGGY